MPPLNEYDAGFRNGQTSATIDDVRDDIRNLSRKLDGILKNCAAQRLAGCGHVGALKTRVLLIGSAVGFLYIWLLYSTFK